MEKTAPSSSERHLMPEANINIVDSRMGAISRMDIGCYMEVIIRPGLETLTIAHMRPKGHYFACFWCPGSFVET